MTSTSTLIKTIIFDAPPDLVWAFLTEKDKLGEWYHPAAADLAAGQSYRLMGRSEDGTPKPQIWGEVLEWDPPRRLVTTFCIEPFGDRTTTVIWELTDVEGGTRLKLTHEGIAEAAGPAALPLLSALDVGWDAHLGDLRRAVAA